MQGAMYGMTPQQLMQAQQLYAQQMQTAAPGGQQSAYGAFQMPPQAGSPWMQQQKPSYAPSFQQMQQHQFTGLAGPSGFP